MEEAAKKTAWRLIPYGMFVLTTRDKQGEKVGAATINWLTQTSFAPPLVAIGVKADSLAHKHIEETGLFASMSWARIRRIWRSPSSSPKSARGTPSEVRTSNRVARQAAPCW